MPDRNVMVGVFVVVGVALFSLVLFMIGSRQQAFARHIDVYTEFTNLDSVVKGARVLVAGMDAGKVVDISVPNLPSSKFRLKLSIEQRLHALVRTDSLVTIDTEGIVGEKFLTIHQGGPQAAEAGSMTTLPSREPIELADLMAQSLGLLKNTNSAITGLGTKLSTSLDAVTSTVNNANDLVVGLKEGKGTAGMLLKDEATAVRIRQTLENVRQSTASLRHASSEADAMVVDLQSRQLGQKAEDTMVDAKSAIQSAKSAAENIDATSQQLHQTLEEVLGPDDQGVFASTNIQQSLSNLDQATGNIADDTEAIKHSFLFRGFFKRRGYYNLAHLGPDQYRHDKLFTDPGNHREWFTGQDLFLPGPNGLEMLSLAGKKRIDTFATQFAESLVARSIVVEGYAATQDDSDQFAVSRNRAILVSQYLHAHFHLDVQNIGVVSLSSQPPPGTRKDTWEGVCIVLLK